MASTREKQANMYKDQGNNAFSAGKLEEALHFYSLAIQNYDMNHVLFSNRSATYCNLKKYSQALADAEQCIKLNPKFAKGYHRKASALLGINDYAEALKAAEVGLAIEPNNAPLLACVQEALKLKEKDAVAPVAENLSSAVAGNANAVEEANMFKEKGNKEYADGNNEEAVLLFSEAIRLDGNNHVLYSNRSAAYARMRRWNEAMKDAKSCIQIKPDWPKGYSRKAAAHQGLGQIDVAIATCREGLEYEPGNAGLNSLLEDLYKAKRGDDVQGNQQESTAGQEDGNEINNSNNDNNKYNVAVIPQFADIKPLSSEEEMMLNSFITEIEQEESVDPCLRVMGSRLNPYEVLQVPVDASAELIQAAGRRVSMSVHPDKVSNPSAAEAFQIVQKAIEELSTPERREFYDRIYKQAKLTIIQSKKKKAKLAAKSGEEIIDTAKIRETLFSSSAIDPEEQAKERKRKKTADEEIASAELDPEEIRVHVFALLDQMEMKRKKVAVKQQQYSVREKTHMAKAREEYKEQENFDKAWEKTREERVSTWRDWQGGKKPRTAAPFKAPTKK